MSGLLEEFIKKLPNWAKILLILGGMFVSGFGFHEKVMADLDQKFEQKLSNSPAMIATVYLKTELANLVKLSDERDQKTQARLDVIDADIKQILRGQQTIIIQANKIQSHVQTLKTVAQNIRHDTNATKQDAEFIRENAVINKKKK